MVEIAPTGDGLRPARLEELQWKLGCDLPGEFRSFLLETNGGIPTPDHYRIDESPQTPFSDIQTIFGVDTPNDYDDLEKVYQDVAPSLPSGFLPIGHSSTNDLICLSLRGDDFGTVYFWDSWGDEVQDSSTRSGYSNLYFIAQDFSEFLNSLKPYEGFARSRRVAREPDLTVSPLAKRNCRNTGKRYGR